MSIMKSKNSSVSRRILSAIYRFAGLSLEQFESKYGKIKVGEAEKERVQKIGYRVYQCPRVAQSKERRQSVFVSIAMSSLTFDEYESLTKICFPPIYHIKKSRVYDLYSGSVHMTILEARILAMTSKLNYETFTVLDVPRHKNNAMARLPNFRGHWQYTIPRGRGNRSIAYGDNARLYNSVKDKSLFEIIHLGMLISMPPTINPALALLPTTMPMIELSESELLQRRLAFWEARKELISLFEATIRQRTDIIVVDDDMYDDLDFDALDFYDLGGIDPGDIDSLV